jgi:membrane-bound lytic murein transglycosylase MltF
MQEHEKAYRPTLKRWRFRFEYCGMRKIYILFPIILLFGSPVVCAGESEPVTSKYWTRKYDPYFKKYTKRYFGPGHEWKWFKAQAIAESNLKEDVKSWVNAKGIMQLMPDTFQEIQKKNPSFVSIDNPRWNIAAGIYYDSQLYQKWKAPRPLQDRLSFTFGSYNAGFRTIVRAQHACRKAGLNENYWQSIKTVAPKMPRWRYKETVGYIDKIHILMAPITQR